MSQASMSVQDALWLTMDRPNNLMVIDGTTVLREVPDRSACRATFEGMVARFPVFTRTPVRVDDGWAWVDESGFDLDDHLEFVEYDEPIDLKVVQQFVARQRSIPLPGDRPRWQGFILSPVALPDGSLGAAVVCRFHHAIADGVRLTQVMLSMCEADESAIPEKVGRGAHPKSGDRHTVSLSDGILRAFIDAGAAARRAISATVEEFLAQARDPRGAVAEAPQRTAGAVMSGINALGEAVDLIRHPDRFMDVLEVYGFEHNRGTNDLSSLTKLVFTESAEAPWTGTPGIAKVVSWSVPLPLSEIKRVGRQTGATVNDVLIAAVAGGLRRYLLARGRTPAEVVWMVPVNLKPFADNLPAELGNYFALVMVSMDLRISDPQARLQHMHNRMQRIKNSDEAIITFGVQRAVSASPGRLSHALTNFFANKAVGVLTNVPGPASPVTFAGAPVYQIVGFAPCSGNQPMTATIFSYNGTVTIGFATDAELVPDASELADFVIEDLVEMGVDLA